MKPGDDLVATMEKFGSNIMSSSSSAAAFVLTAVGSLEYVKLRMASACKSNSNEKDNDIKEWKQKLEIISLVGTLSVDGKHLHMSVSDELGNVFGGHLVAGTIFTTLELVIGVIQNDIKFSRELDYATGYNELVVSKSTKRNRDEEDDE
jgi:predicted DNA-binding protein with PD1-like motif